MRNLYQQSSVRLTMKITKTSEKRIGKETTKFFVDGVHVATTKKYQEWFCTVRNGQRSNIRDRMKTAKETSWERAGLIQVLGEAVTSQIETYNKKNVIFKDSHPDFSWGDSGSLLTAKQIKEKFEKYVTLSQGDSLEVVQNN